MAKYEHKDPIAVKPGVYSQSTMTTFVCMAKGEPMSENKFVAKRCGMNYYRYDARLGSWRELTEKEFNRAIKKKYVLPVWDDYWQRFSEKTFVDTRDSIVRIFYIKGERRTDE